MTIKYGFFNSVNGDRLYNAEDIGRYLQGIICSGVYADSSTSLQVLAGDGMTVQVQPGRAMLNYHYMENDEPLELTLAAGGTQARVDAIVARVDLDARRCEIVVKEGTPAASPVAPTMTRSDVKMEYMLASVRVGALASSITQDHITDTRPDNTVCGWVTGVIDQVDTSALFAQWQAAYERTAASLTAYAETMQRELTAWYAALTEELDVRTYIQEYRNIVTLAEDTDTVPIGINDFVAAEDVLFVNYRGLLYMEEDYTLHGDGAEAYVVLKEARNAGDPVEFRVLKSKIGSATQASATVLALESDDGSALTDDGTVLSLE